MAKNKQNVGKALSDKSLEELYEGRLALLAGIEQDKAVLDSLGPGNRKNAEDKDIAGLRLEAKFKFLDLLDDEIGFQEMDNASNKESDDKPSPYDEEALDKALATGGEVDAPDWVIDALLEMLPPGTVEAGKAKIVSSPEGGETTTEAAESWRGLQAKSQALEDAPGELYYDKVVPAGDVLRSKWGLPGWIRGDLVPEVDAILALEAKGKLQLDPELKADLEGYKAVDRQTSRASDKSWKWLQEQEAKHGVGPWKPKFEERAQYIEEEFPEAKKKAE